MRHQSRQRSRNSGFTLVEAAIASIILAIVIIAAITVFNQTTKNVNSNLRQGQGIAASRNVTSIIESVAMYDPTVLQQMKVGAQINLNSGTGSGPKTKNNQDQLVALTLIQAPSPGAGDNLEYTFSYLTASKATGTVVVPIHRLGTTTSGCDPTNGLTTNCSNYVVPGN